MRYWWCFGNFIVFFPLYFGFGSDPVRFGRFILSSKRLLRLKLLTVTSVDKVRGGVNLLVPCSFASVRISMSSPKCPEFLDLIDGEVLFARPTSKADPFFGVLFDIKRTSIWRGARHFNVLGRWCGTLILLYKWRRVCNDHIFLL